MREKGVEDEPYQSYALSGNRVGGMGKVASQPDIVRTIAGSIASPLPHDGCIDTGGEVADIGELRRIGDCPPGCEGDGIGGLGFQPKTESQSDDKGYWPSAIGFWLLAVNCHWFH